MNYINNLQITKKKKFMINKKIVLASTSPRRKELLRQIGLDFKAVASDYVEDMSLELKPSELAKYLSRGKAMAVGEKYKDDIIVAADTFVVYKNKILGKPHTAKNAAKILRMLSGKKLEVVTGFTVIDPKSKKIISKAVSTRVSIKKLGQKEIDDYIATGEPLDKAGAFGIQERGVLFIKKIEGSYTNVVGLPLLELVEVLGKIKI